jgi:hypothetical protein
LGPPSVGGLFVYTSSNKEVIITSASGGFVAANLVRVEWNFAAL